MNWKKLVEKKNSETYVLPKGWDSRATVAEQLDCPEDKVDQNLRPALKSGEVEKRQFVVWDKDLGRKVMVVAYRETGSEPTRAFDIEKAKALKKAGKSWAEVGAAFGMSGENVRAKIRRAG